VYVSRDSPDMTSLKFFEKGRGQGHVIPKIFGTRTDHAPT